MQRCPHSSAPEGAGCCIKALRLRSTRSFSPSQSTNKSLLIAAARRTESASKGVRCMPLDGISEGYRCCTARDRAKSEQVNANL